MSEKRPETSADIVTRSQRVSSRLLAREKLKSKKSYSVNLQHHMAECDANYARLMRLFPDLRHSETVVFNLALPNMRSEIAFRVVERGPYTTLIEIDGGTTSEWRGLTAPQMQVRAYHDAQSAEVVSYQNQRTFHGKYDYPNARMRQRDEKVQINRFLSEFLGLCLEYGETTRPVF